MRSLARPIALAAFAPLAIWIGCAVYDSSLLTQAGAPDAAADAGDAAVDADLCAHAVPPDRPAADDPGGADVDAVMALSSFDLGFDGGSIEHAFDLDRTCTCPEPESCKPAANAPKHCDGDGGRDNSGGALLAKFSLVAPELTPAGLASRLAGGRSGVLLRVRKYNGLANDTSVELSVLTSSGTTPLTDGGPNPAPKHDGTDHWAVAKTSLVGGVGPPYVSNYVDDKAYVTGGVLVATLDFPLSLTGSFSASFILLRGALLQGRLTKDPAGWALHDLRVGGRWDSRNLLTGMQVIEDPLNAGQYLCGTNVTYQSLKGEICRAADITVDPRNDRSSASCDAVSLGVGGDTEPAILDGVTDDQALGVAPCGASYSDQCGL